MIRFGAMKFVSLSKSAARSLVRTALPALLVFTALPVGSRAQGETLRGRWEMELLREGDTLGVMLERKPEGGGTDKRFFQIKLDELTGVTRDQITVGVSAASFRLRRRLGTFDFAGSFASGKGAGAFTFTADADAVAALEREGYGEAVRQDLFGLAIGDHGGRLAEDLAALGVERPTAEQLRQMAQFGVSVRFVKELRALEYEPRSVAELIELRRHGVTADQIRSLQERGYGRPPLGTLVDMRRQGVSAQFIEQLRERGYNLPPLELLTRMRQQGVTIQFIDELKSLGYERVPLGELIEMRKHGVTPDFIRQLSGQGYAHVPLRHLINVRMLGMPAELLRHMPAEGEREKTDGEWLLKLYSREADEAWLYLSGGQDGGGHSVAISLAQLRGLNAEQAFSEGGKVSFTVTLKGRTLNCAGWFKDGYGAGVFTSTPSAPGQH
jgi:hypothetical protein